MVTSPTRHEPHADDLIAEYILHAPDADSIEDARLAGFGVPVWALVGYLPAAQGDLGAIAEAYELPLDAVLAAFAYYARHRSTIDARLAANMSPDN